MIEHTKSNLTVSGDYLMGRCVGGCQLKEGEFMVAQVRGWGYLQYLGEEKAMAIQKANAERLALCWNSYESDQKLIKDLVEALGTARDRLAYYCACCKLSIPEDGMDDYRMKTCKPCKTAIMLNQFSAVLAAAERKGK